jgi:hypothetical protein
MSLNTEKGKRIQVTSLKNFDVIIEKYKTSSSTYRGQTNSKWQIDSSLTRNSGYILNEVEFYSDACKRDEVQRYGSKFSRLSYMQHYGYPTRLIDITSDPYIALYFAVENCENNEDGEVLIFVEKLLPDSDSEIAKILDNYLSKDNHYLHNSKHVFVRKTKASSNPRSSLQQAEFIIQGSNVDDNGDVVFKPIRKADCVVIPFVYKQEIKEQLNLIKNINESTVYPEITSHSNYLKYKYFYDELKIEETYVIEVEEDISIVPYGRISLKIYLLKKLSYRQLVKICKKLINDYSMKFEIIYIFIAENKQDFVSYNWVLKCDWYSQKIEPLSKYSQLVDNYEGERIVISRSGDHITKNESFSTIIFGESNYELLKKHTEELFQLKECLFDLKEVKLDSDFDVFVDKHCSKIVKVFMSIGENGHSEDIEFNSFLEEFHALVGDLLSICDWYKNQQAKNKYWSCNKSKDEALVRYKGIVKDIPKWIEFVDGLDEIMFIKDF